MKNPSKRIKLANVTTVLGDKVKPCLSWTDRHTADAFLPACGRKVKTPKR